MKRPKWLRIAALMGCVLWLGVGAIGCNVEDVENPRPDNRTTTPDPDTGTPPDPDTGTPPDPDTGTPPDPDTGTPPDPDTGTPPEPEELAEAHQLCAAAGSSSDGSLTAFHCFAPHDISGFEASGSGMTWQPGAFRVIAQ